MTAIVTVMVIVVIVALVVISIFTQEDDGWTTNRPGRSDRDEATIDDLFKE